MNIFPPKSDIINELKNITFFSTLSDSDLNLKEFFSNESFIYSKKYVKKMLAGEKVNFTESKPALHFSSRFINNNTNGDILKKDNTISEIKAMLSLSNKIRTGKFGHVKDIIHIGTGGSNLGPMLIHDTFKYKIDGPNVHFVSNTYKKIWFSHNCSHIICFNFTSSFYCRFFFKTISDKVLKFY